jgi:hypothetical protein
MDHSRSVNSSGASNALALLARDLEFQRTQLEGGAAAAVARRTSARQRATSSAM